MILAADELFIALVGRFESRVHDVSRYAGGALRQYLDCGFRFGGLFNVLHAERVVLVVPESPGIGQGPRTLELPVAVRGRKDILDNATA